MPSKGYVKGLYKHGTTAYMKDWWRKNPEKYLLAAAKKRAKVKGIEFNISEQDIHIPEVCPITKCKLSEVHQPRGNKENSPTLDRKDNNKGYVKGNVAVISFRANRLKSDMSKETLENLLKYVSDT